MPDWNTTTLGVVGAALCVAILAVAAVIRWRNR